MTSNTRAPLSKLEGKDLKEEALRLCHQFLGSPWTEVNVSDFKFTTVSGGLSNSLYCCSLPDNAIVKNQKSPKHVLLRVYGPVQEDEHIVLVEVTTFVILSEKNLGPKLYGVFPNGRLEEYIPSRSLKSNDIRRWSTTIAREMAKIHALDIPVKKSPDLFPTYMRKWLQAVEEENVRKFNQKFPHLETFGKEMEWLTKEMEKSNSPIVYCHNDLQGGNILLRNDSPSETDPNIILIDFEYGGYNYRGFDIANHFCEWMFDYNTPEPPYFVMNTEKYPSKEEQIEYIRAYLDQLVIEGRNKSSSVDEETEKILAEVPLFGMASNLLWSLWSEKWAFLNIMDFAHRAHAEARRKLFRNFKEEYLQRNSHLCNGNGEE